VDNITKIVLAITSIGLASTLLVNYSGTTAIIGSASRAYNSALSQAQSGK
jgi:hypothetical protein